MKQVRKAVIAAAGFGTRFLPQTKAMPKEMLPIIDKPIIQYIVEELVAAGIEDIIIVTGYAKRSIEDHFDIPNQDLVQNLEAGGEGKRPLIDQVHQIASMANFVYIRQKGPYGNATPVENAAPLIGDEPFIYTFADDFVLASPPRFVQMVDIYKQYNASVISCVRADNDDDYNRYGYAAGNEFEDGLIKLERIIEKPGRKYAPSDLASVSSYLFTPDIFQHIIRPNDGSEHYIQPAIQSMVDSDKMVIAFEVKNGKYYDTANKLEYIKTVVDFALADPNYSRQLKLYLKERLDK